MASIDLLIKIMTISERGMVRDITINLGCISFCHCFQSPKTVQRAHHVDCYYFN